MTSGTRGYGEESEEFVRRSEAIPFEEKHRHVLHLLPLDPCRVLDIGAGSGGDAARFVALGHQVVAVEPADELRSAAIALHPSERIEWGNDSLPYLEWTRSLGRRFDLVMMTGVWMHLDEAERQQAMPNVASLIDPGGLLIMSIRHGWVPPNKLMFPVSAEETISLAQTQGLVPLLHVEADSIQPTNRQANVTWSHLAFSRAG